MPGSKLTIDEGRSNFNYKIYLIGMIPFKGRVVFRQYIPRKPHTTGVKYWAMVDSFGYLYSFEIYIGAKKFESFS